MATEGELSPSRDNKPDENIFCTPCLKDNKHTAAENYCEQCREYLCGSCLTQHSRFTILQNHQLLDKARMASIMNSPDQPTPHSSALHDHQLPNMTGTSSTMTTPDQQTPQTPSMEMCSRHLEKGLEMFCGQHDIICCCACVAIEHRSCQGIDYLPIVADGVKTGSEFTHVCNSMKTFRNELDDLRNARNRDSQRIGKEKTDMVTMIKTFREKMNKLLDDFEQTTLEQLQTKHDKLAAEIKQDVQQLEAMIQSLDTKIKYLQEESNESQLFVAMKKSKKVINYAIKLSDTLKESVGMETVKLNMDGNIDLFCQTVISNWYSFRRCLSYKETIIRVKGDTKKCDIFGSCQLDNGQIVITDATNRRLKRMNHLYEVVDYLELSSAPWGVCAVGPGEVAVTLEKEKKIEFISIGEDMSFISSFCVGMHCRGVAYHDGDLYVCCGDSQSRGPGQVHVYDKSRKLLRTLQHDAGQSIFSWPQHISISPDGIHIYVADADKGLIVVNKQGHIVSTMTDPKLKGHTGVLINDKSEVFLCGSPSHNILNLGDHGRRLGLLLKQSDGVTWPRSICYDKHNSRLMITMWSDTIKVFDMV